MAYFNCSKDFMVVVSKGCGINVSLPTRTVTVTDNDGADITITALVNEGGVLTPKSVKIPTGGAATITYAWRTPVFIASKYSVSMVEVYDAEGDLMKYCPCEYDATNQTYAFFPQSDGGDNHHIFVYC